MTMRLRCWMVVILQMAPARSVLAPPHHRRRRRQRRTSGISPSHSPTRPHRHADNALCEVSSRTSARRAAPCTYWSIVDTVWLASMRFGSGAVRRIDAPVPALLDCAAQGVILHRQLETENTALGALLQHVPGCARMLTVQADEACLASSAPIAIVVQEVLRRSRVQAAAAGACYRLCRCDHLHRSPNDAWSHMSAAQQPWLQRCIRAHGVR